MPPESKRCTAEKEKQNQVTVADLLARMEVSKLFEATRLCLCHKFYASAVLADHVTRYKKKMKKKQIPKYL